MEVTVKLNYLIITPRKVRLVADAVRGKKAEQAQTLLRFFPQRAAKSMLKLLNSGIATAEKDFHLSRENLYISRILVNEGPKMKRFRPVSRGSAHPYWKRESHIVLTLGEIKPSAEKGEPAKKAKKETVKTAEQAVATKPEEKATTEKNIDKKSKPKFGKEAGKKQKGPGVFKKVFQRKSI